LSANGREIVREETVVSPGIVRATARAVVVLTACGAVLAADAPEKPPQELKLGGIWMVKGGRVDVPADQATAADLYSFAGTTRIDGTLQGDVATFAANVHVPGMVDGDVWSFTEDVTIDGTVTGGLRAAANGIAIRGSVGRNAMVLANKFRLGPGGRIAGSVAAYAGATTIEGGIGGSLLARSGKVEINGPIDGDVDVRCDELSFGPLARIGGRLSYSARNEVAVPPGIVGGAVTRGPEPGAGATPDATAEEEEGSGFGVRALWRGYLAVVALVAGVALLLFFRPFVDGALERTASGNGLGASFGIGLVGLLVLLVAGVLCVCLLQLPLAAGIWSALGALVYFGGVIGKIVLGLWALTMLRRDSGRDASASGPPRAAWTTTHPVLALVVGVGILFLLTLIPYLGNLVWLIVTVTGMGAALLQLRGEKTEDVLPDAASA
jgi:cytoskeletal protein CcmA (bactofilin family)